MIEQPRRAVTRFFVPLIDVLILLFCIFLLMPYVQSPANEPGADRAKPPEPPVANAEQLNHEVDLLRRERDRLLDERARVLDRLAIRVLEIDRDTGKLFDYDPRRVEVATADEAQKLIERHKRASGGRDVYFLILFPHQSSGYPLERQVAAYSKWFQDVPHGFDNPRGRQ